VDIASYLISNSLTDTVHLTTAIDVAAERPGELTLA
jgi:hypothetical protein